MQKYQILGVVGEGTVCSENFLTAILGAYGVVLKCRNKVFYS
jgi:hypothetical protein